jgi:hypothetical protein
MNYLTLRVDFLYRRGHHVWSRRLPAMIGFSLATASVLAVANAGTAEIAVVLVGLATFGGFVSANAFPLLHLYTGTPAAYFYTAGILNLFALVWW